MSYAFQRDCSGAVKYQQQAFDLQLARNDYTDAAGAANEVARVCLRVEPHRGSHDLRRKGLRHGPEGGRSHPRRTSWQFRWEHAQARIAARRGQKAEADKHVAAAKAVLDKARIRSRRRICRISSATWRFTAATTRPRLRNCRKPIRSPFVLALMAQVHEKLDEDAKAKELCRKILTSRRTTRRTHARGRWRRRSSRTRVG